MTGLRRNGGSGNNGASPEPPRQSPDMLEGLSLGRLLDIEGSHDGVQALVIGAPELLRLVRSVVPASPAVPGLLLEQISLPGVQTLVIDWRGFRTGPWLGANTGTADALRLELSEALVRMTAAGRSVIGLPLVPLSLNEDIRLLEACTSVIDSRTVGSQADGMPQSPLWTLLTRYASTRPEEQEPDPVEVA